MRKSKKTFAILAIVAMVLMMIPVQAFAADNTATRLFGDTRVDTAIAIANNGWANGASTVVVVPANDENLVDALAVAPLAKQLNAPILITDKAGLDAKVAAEIATLKATNVYAVGALSDAAANQLKALSGVTVTTIKGADRFQTAAQVAAKLTNPAGTFVVAYNGLADALSAASFAAANGYAILVADTNGSLPASETIVGSKTYTVGGQVAAISGATSFAGADRYATNDAVIKGLGFKYDKVFVANGETLVDALAGSVLAAQSNSPIVLANTTGAAAAADVKANLTASSQVVAFGGTAVVPDAVVGSISGQNTTPAGTVSVTSVAAISASSIKVVFSAAPADTSKVSFTVTRSTTPVAVTTAWNAAKTEATLTASSNLPEGSYSVAVKNDTTDLGASTVSISQQKIAQIKITSDKLAVTTDPNNNAKQIGYASYTVQDQYGNDITDSYVANSVSFQSGVGNVDWTTSKGLLIITPTSGTLIQFSNVVITGYDTTSGVSTSATLATSTAIGTLSNIKLNSLTNADNKVLTAADISDTWYIDYTATDMSGNETKNYSLVKGGLILGGANKDELTSSAPQYLTAKVVTDPVDSSKAAIAVTLTATDVTMDLPVSITAMSFNGTASTINVTLKKAAATDSFTLMAPSYDIAVGETKEIPFVAYDQNGTQITKYDDLNGDNITFSPNYPAGAPAHPVVELKSNVDGSAKLMVGPFAAKGPQVISAMTQSGKISTLTLNIQDQAEAATLKVDSSVLVSAMQVGATQSVDFGYLGGNGGLSVLDQYGRSIDMIGDYVAPDGGNYVVKATAPNGSAVTPSAAAINGGGEIDITAGATAGQGSITFSLYDDKDMVNAIDSKTVTLSVIASGDIKGYTMDQLSAPLLTAFASGTTATPAPSGRNSDYYQNPYVYGTTSSGSKVVLAGNPITGAYTTSGSFFATQGGTYDSVKVYADKFTDPAKTSSSATLTVTVVNPVDKSIHTVSTPINSTTSGATASTVAMSVDERTAGISVSGDTVTVNVTTNPEPFVTGQILTRWVTGGANDGTLPAGLTYADSSAAPGRAPVYLYAKDQYGTKAMALSQISAIGSAVTDGVFAVNANGLVTFDSTKVPAAGDYADVTVVSNNGMVKTIRLSFTK